MKPSLLILAAVLHASLAGLRAAELKLASVFSHQMVLQREKPVPVWGWSDAASKVTVEFGGQKKDATADADGRWLVKLDPMPASAEPRELRVIQAAIPNPQSTIVKDVLVGDVWLCAGGIAVAKLGTDADAPLDDPKAQPARVFAVTTGTSREASNDAKGRWVTATAANAKSIPAEAAFLARQLGSELGVPVGIVSIAQGYPGLPVESWMSRELLAATPEAAPILAYYASDVWKLRTVGTYEERLKAWMDYCQKLPLNPPPKPMPNDRDTLAKQEPSGAWNAMAAPLASLAVRGLVWDNGEDQSSQGHAFQQGQLLPAMLASWRQTFGDPALPAVIVQLRPHRYAVPHGLDSRLAAELRDAQRGAATSAKAALVVTIDLDADPSPGEITPRIANTILATAYQRQDRDTEGPQLIGAETRGGEIVLRFAHTRDGLQAKGGELKGFAIASSLLRWVWAEARIEADTVIVSAPTVPHPQGVRYAYEDLPSRGATLCDGAGHPAAPFRTDDHLSVTGTRLSPADKILGYSPRTNPGVEDPRLPRILIIGDSISCHYLPEVITRMRGKANVIGESSMRKDGWFSMEPDFYRADWASRGDGLKNFLAARGPFDIVHFNNGIHNFARASPGDEKPYAEQLRKVVAIIRESGAVCLFANSTGTLGDNVIPNSPHYLTNCQAFNAAAEAVMRELNVPVTDIYGLIQPRIKELISPDLIHPKDEASPLMAELICQRLNETLATLPKREP